jgi:hypothetical protein
MKRKFIALLLAIAIGASIAIPMTIVGDQIASATTIKKHKKKAPPPYRYQNDRNENMPGTNFRAARPEEYPRIFGGDCDLWRFGRSMFDCEEYFFYPRRNPETILK